LSAASQDLVTLERAGEEELRELLLQVTDGAALALAGEHQAGDAEDRGGVAGRELLRGLVVGACGLGVLADAGDLTAQEQRLGLLLAVAELGVEGGGLAGVSVGAVEFALLEGDDTEHVDDGGVGVAALLGEQEEWFGGGAGVVGHLHAGPQEGEVRGEVALGGEGCEVALEDALGELLHVVVGGAAGGVGGDAGAGDATLDLEGGQLVGDRGVEVGEHGLDRDVAGFDRGRLVEVALAGGGRLGVDVLEAPHHAADAAGEVEGGEVGPGDGDPVAAVAVGQERELAVGRPGLAGAQQFARLLDRGDGGGWGVAARDLEQRGEVEPCVPRAHRRAVLGAAGGCRGFAAAFAAGAGEDEEAGDQQRGEARPARHGAGGYASARRPATGIAAVVGALLPV
jgi:hypothetical protein